METLKNRSLVVIPTYNEAENISRLLYELTRGIAEVDVVVVDDSSPDGTAGIVEQFMRHTPRVQLLTRPKKDGLAGAYITGFTWGLQRHYENFVQMDADFSHQPSDVARFLKLLEDHDVVVGCRYIEGGEVSGWGVTRQFISRGGNFYAQRVLGLPFKDLTGGFNGWRRKALEQANISTVKSKGYAYQVEMKCRAHRAGFKVAELPIHFVNRKLGRSKMSSRIVWEAAFRVLAMRRAQ